MTRTVPLRRRVRAALLALVLAVTLVPAAAASAADDDAVIAGRLLLPFDTSPQPPAISVTVYFEDAPGRQRTAIVGRDGSWQVDGLSAGRYTVLARGPFVSGSDYAYTWHGGGASRKNAEVISVKAGERRDVVTRIPRAGHVVGTFPEGVSGVFRAEVMTGPDQWESAWAATVGVEPGTRSWYVDGLPAGTYRLYFEPSEGDVASGWLGGGDDADSARLFQVSEGAVVDAGIFTPRSAGRIEGVVTDTSGRPLDDVSISLRSKASSNGLSTTSDATGRFTFKGLDTGEYSMKFTTGDPYVTSFSNNVYPPFTEDVPAASYVSVTAEQTTTVEPVRIRRSSIVRGRVTDRLGVPQEFVEVTLKPFDPALRGLEPYATGTAADGTYEILVPFGVEGTLSFRDRRGRFATEFHRDAATAAKATPVVLETEGTAVVHARLDPLQPRVDVASPTFGQVLTARLPRAHPVVPERGTWAWLRDGVEIPYATGPSYTAQAADLGKRLTARFVANARWDLENLVPHDSAPSQPVVAAVTDLRVTATALGGRQVRITATATSPTADAYMLDAKVVASIVRPGDDRTRTLTMVDGKLTYVLTNQPLGRQTYYADLLATPGLLPDRSPQSVVTVR